MRDLVDELLEAKVKTKLFGGERAPKLGRLAILDRIGSGAMGTVFAAYDPQLERKVAIKVLREGHVGVAEARALAKLSHPNVVAIHDVGEVDGLSYIVMELAPGVPLRAWTASHDRSWREIMHVLREAAAGIAAAHAAGLVHRDIKPDNVLVGAASGGNARARVVDFGLAYAVDDGKRAGTPGYMAPEVLAGGAVTAASDQYSFGVTMYEALYGERPDARAVREGKVLPLNTSVPLWVHAIVQRTLAADPTQRFTAMSDVVAALSRDRRRVRFAAIIGATAIVGAGLGALTMHHGAGDPCNDAAKHRASVWNEATRAGVRGGLGGAPWTARTIAALDDASAAWEHSYKHVCEATRVHGSQSDALLELRMRCLDRALERFGALAGALAGPLEAKSSPDAPHAPTGALDRAAQAAAPAAVAELPRPDACETLADAAELALPADTSQRDRAIEAERDLDRGWAAFGLGRYKDARAIAAAASAKLAPLEAPALRATALVLAAAVEARIGTADDAHQKLSAALDATAAARAGTLELDVWARMLRSELFAGDPAHVVEWAPFARAAAARAGRKGAEIDGIVAQALRENGKLREARELLDRALASTDPLRADQRAILELNLGSIELAIGHGAAATAIFQRARDRVIGTFGDRHPEIAIYDDKLAATATARGHIRDALVLVRDSLELRTAAFGDDDRATATTYLQRARTELEAGELDKADTDLNRARDIRTRVFGERSPRLGEIDAALGDVATAHGDFAAARTLYAHAHDLDARLELTARMWFATADGPYTPLAEIPTLAPDETLTVDRVTALYVRASILMSQLVPEDGMQVAFGVSQQWSADLDPAMMVAIARVEFGGGYRDKAADHFAAALAHSGNEPTRTQLDAAIGLAQCADPRAPQAARTAISLYQAMPQLARTATYALMLKLSKT